MRNIRGSLNDSYEVFPDEGDVDFSNVTRVLRETQFPGSICPDHMPGHPTIQVASRLSRSVTDTSKALIQAVNSEGLRSY
jgi:D-mannonate dehydratase